MHEAAFIDAFIAASRRVASAGSIPGKLGYLETEPGDRYLLRRAQPRRTSQAT